MTELKKDPELMHQLQLAMDENRLIITDYPCVPRVRPLAGSGSGTVISKICEGASESVTKFLQSIKNNKRFYESISTDGNPDSREIYWNNGMLPPLDGLLIYNLIALHRPKTYFEVGSGNSTKFARKAISDHNLSTRIVSIDPVPRAYVDDICDVVIRRPFEDVSTQDYLSYIDSGDVVYIDNSHRSFQSSDVTVFFLEMLPALPSKVIYGLHDIFLPFDYPSEWLGRFYNEQYLLACYLLGGAAGDATIFPGIYASQSRANDIDEVFTELGLRQLERHSGAFWMRRA